MNGSRKRKHLKLSLIRDITKKASIGARRYMRGKTGLWMHMRRQVDISWNYAKRAGAFLRKLASSGLNSNPWHSWIGQYSDRTLWKIFEYLDRMSHKGWVLTLGAIAGTVDNIRRGRQVIKQEIRSRGYKTSLYKKYNKASQPVLVIPFHHKHFGRWHAKNSLQTYHMTYWSYS